MLFKLTVPVPARHLDSSDIYNRHYYFNASLSPTKNQVLSTLKHSLRMMENGTLIYNGNELRKDLQVAIEQIETIANEDFPQVSQLGYVSSCNVETRFGPRRLTLTIIVPMRIEYGSFKNHREERNSEREREPLTVKYD